MTRKVIVRADDLGYSDGVNAGIARSVNQGIIRSVGVMPNMPLAADGLALLKKEDICLGLHANICAGKPLCDPALIPSLIQENGDFLSSKIYRSAPEDFAVLEEVILEIEAQYQRFKELTGGKPGYMEGHAVQSPAFFKGLEIVARRHQIPFLPFDLQDPVVFHHSRLRLIMESMKPDYDPAHTLRQIVESDENDGVIPVMVCHPGYLDAFLLRTSSLLRPRALEVEMATDPELKEWLIDHDIEIITFDEVE